MNLKKLILSLVHKNMTKQNVLFIRGTSALFEVKKTIKNKSKILLIFENKQLLNFAKEFRLNYKNYIILNKYSILKNAQLFVIFFYLKLTKANVFFYHNNYWPFFDFLINLFKINAIQNILTFEDFTGNNKINKKVKNIFKISNLTIIKKLRYFILLNTIYKKHQLFYRKSYNKCKDDIIIFANFKYHQGIVKNLNYTNYFKNQKKHKKSKKTKKKILLLPTKIYPQKFSITQKTFNFIIDCLVNTKHDIYFKDHPTESSLLEFKKFNKLKKIKILQRKKIIENIKIDFDIIFGFGTTGLIRYNSKAVSLVKFYGKSAYIDQKKYYDMNGAKLIKYPGNQKEIKKILKSYL